MTQCPHCGLTHAPENHFCPSTGRPIDLGPRLVSQLLLDQFKVLRILGKSPISIVLEIEEIESKTHFAAKLIHPQYTRDKESEKMLEDALKTGRLKSPHLARVVKAGRDAGAALTVVRELIIGECLEDLLKTQGRLPIQRAIKITREILMGLETLHNAGILVLDLSPSDVFLAEQDGVEIAKLVDIGEHHIKHKIIVESKEKLESSNYYAPEQFDTSRQKNIKTDIFAVGSILYRMVVGKILPGILSDADDLSRDVDPALAKVIKKATASIPASRFNSAIEFIAALDDLEKSDKSIAGGAKDISAKKSKSDAPLPVLDNSKETPVSELLDVQPTVIVDMPEIDKRLPSRIVKAVLVSALLVIIGIIISYVFLKDGQTKDEEKAQEMVTITINVDPKKAAVTIDGKPLDGNPAVLNTQKDDKFHTISAKFDGFESVERYVKFDVSQTVTLALIEIIKPEETAQAKKDTQADAGATSGESDEPEIGPKEKVEGESGPTDNSTAIESKETQPRKSISTVNKDKPKPKTKEKKETRKNIIPEKTREGFSTTNPFK